jgi:hypothetical protein
MRHGAAQPLLLRGQSLGEQRQAQARMPREQAGLQAIEPGLLQPCLLAQRAA